MKKLKIFLLLSILLCLGFVLSSEVHAQGNGPKIFEEGDVLPATTQLRISWNGTKNAEDVYDLFYEQYNDGRFKSDLDNFSFVTGDSNDLYLNGVYIVRTPDDDNFFMVSPFTVSGGGHAYIDIDTSSWSLSKRTISTIPGPSPFNSNIYFTWEDLNAPSAKIFEIGDVLPAGYIKISWDFTGKPIPEDPEDFVVSSSSDLFIEIFYGSSNIQIDINYEEFYANTPGYTIISLTEPCEITDVTGTSDYNTYIGDALRWEALPPEYIGDYDDLYDGELLDIEEDYILPQSKVGIKLLYNNTGGPKSGTITYTFGTYGQIILTAQEDNSSTQVTSAEITYNFTNPNWNIYMIDDSLANQSFGSTRGILFAGVLLDFTYASEEERTITDITIDGDLDIDVVFTRILTEEEIAYQEGYSNGYTTAREIFGWKDGDTWYNGIDAWNLGEKYARELYGFYDSKTNEWLTVDEYVARYGPGNGNGSPGSSDFYANFDKYFIPAMIIVFGGAIVLTILKVFKGRE